MNKNKDKIKKKDMEKEQKTLQELLKDPVYVSYNTLLKLNNLSTHLEEIKKINYSILEIMNALYQKILIEESPKESKKKEVREGTLATGK